MRSLIQYLLVVVFDSKYCFIILICSWKPSLFSTFGISKGTYNKKFHSYISVNSTLIRFYSMNRNIIFSKPMFETKLFESKITVVYNYLCSFSPAYFILLYLQMYVKFYFACFLFQYFLFNNFFLVPNYKYYTQILDLLKTI